MLYNSNQIYRNSANEMYVNYSGTGHTLLGNGTGNVGINIGTNPSYRLQVGGTLGVSGAATFSSSVDIAQSATVRGFSGNAGAGLFINYGSAGAGIGSLFSYNYGTSTYGGTVIDGSYVSIYNSGTPRMTVTGGNVGIGLTNPQTQLHLNGVITFTEANLNTVRLNQISSAHSDGNSANNNLRFLVSNGSGTTAERMRINGEGNVGIGRTSPRSLLAIYGGPIQIMQDYQGHQTIIRSVGAVGSFSGALTITIPEMDGAGSSQGFGGYSCEVYVSGFSGAYCHAWFSGYINNGITTGEATILRSNGGWSISQSPTGTWNQGFVFTLDYVSIVHPTARIIFNKGGDQSIAEYTANNITASFS